MLSCTLVFFIRLSETLSSNTHQTSSTDLGRKHHKDDKSALSPKQAPLDQIPKRHLNKQLLKEIGRSESRKKGKERKMRGREIEQKKQNEGITNNALRCNVGQQDSAANTAGSLHHNSPYLGSFVHNALYRKAGWQNNGSHSALSSC